MVNEFKKRGANIFFSDRGGNIKSNFPLHHILAA